MNRYLLLALMMVMASAGAFAADPSPWLTPSPPGLAYPPGEEARQFAMLAHDLQNRDRFNRVAAETYRPESLILASDRDPLDVILRRTAALLADIVRLPGAPSLAALESELKALQARAAATAPADAAARRDLFDNACHLRRRIAFANPLLSFDSLLFIKRHRSIYNHMCDQFYGITQKPGGGIFVLANPFGDKPELRDVLAPAIIEGGRLNGQALSGGLRAAQVNAEEIERFRSERELPAESGFVHIEGPVVLASLRQGSSGLEARLFNPNTFPVEAEINYPALLNGSVQPVDFEGNPRGEMIRAVQGKISIPFSPKQIRTIQL
jgi:hypothetical protein